MIAYGVLELHAKICDLHFRSTSQTNDWSEQKGLLSFYIMLWNIYGKRCISRFYGSTKFLPDNSALIYFVTKNRKIHYGVKYMEQLRLNDNIHTE